MSRDATLKAQRAFDKSNQTADQYNTAGKQVSGVLTPALEQEATNPQGFSVSDQNAMTTAAGQAAGGEAAQARGQAGLRAARTRNVGAGAAMADEAGRQATRTQADAALGVQQKNALLKETQRQAGMEGLGHEYDTNTHATLSALGLLPEDVNAQSNAGKSGWFQNMTNLISSLGGAAAGAGKLNSSLHGGG